MTRCQCANERRPDTATKQFRWGGCSDNVKHGKRVARNFLELQPLDSEGDESTVMLRHDSEVGIMTVMGSLGEKCKCHGETYLMALKCITKSETSFQHFRCFGQLFDADMLEKTQRLQHNVSCTTCEISSGSKENLFRESITSCSKSRASRAFSYDWNRLQWPQLSRHWNRRVTARSRLRAVILPRAVSDVLCSHEGPTMHEPRQLLGSVLRPRLHDACHQAGGKMPV